MVNLRGVSKFISKSIEDIKGGWIDGKDASQNDARKKTIDDLKKKGKIYTLMLQLLIVSASGG